MQTKRLTTKPTDEVIAAIQALDLASVKTRLMDAELGEGWTQEYADSIEQAVNDAVVEFTEVLADIQQKFFDTLTHDLRTPVAVARMNAQITLRRGDLAGPAIAAQNNILISLNRLDSMI